MTMRGHLHKRRRSLGWYHSWSRYSFMYSWIEACCLIYLWCGLILTFSCRNESFSSAIPFSELLQVLFRMYCMSSKLYRFVDVWVRLIESFCWNNAVICSAVFLSDNFFMAFPDIITTDVAGSVQEWIWYGFGCSGQRVASGTALLYSRIEACYWTNAVIWWCSIVKRLFLLAWCRHFRAETKAICRWRFQSQSCLRYSPISESKLFVEQMLWWEVFSDHFVVAWCRPFRAEAKAVCRRRFQFQSCSRYLFISSRML